MSESYIATKPILVGTALAHAVGDEVPAENVKVNGWEDSVSRGGTKSAQEAVKPSEGLSRP